MTDLELMLRTELREVAVVQPDPKALQRIQAKVRTLRVRRRVAAGVSLAAVVAAGSIVVGSVRPSAVPTSPAATSSPSPVSPARAEAAVAAFYRAIAAHDPAANQFVQPAMQPAVDYLITNYVSLTQLVVRAGQACCTAPGDLPAAAAGYVDVFRVSVSYDVVLKAPSGNEATGPMGKFLLVGRASASSPWVILEFASSP